MSEPLLRVLAQMRGHLLDPEALVKAVASGRQRGTQPRWRRVELRYVDLKAGRHLQITSYDETQAHTANFAAGEPARDAVDDIQGAIDQATVSPPAAGHSLLNPKPLKAALAKLPPGSLQSLRVAPERIDAQVFTDGSLHVVQVTSTGRVTDVKTAVAARQPRLRVDPQAPRRMARAAAKQAGRPVSEVAYLVLGRSGWDLFFTDGRHYSAGPAGRHVKHVA